MPKLSQGSGRTAQKARTRAAIVGAARRLGRPGIEEAADAAGVSRATAYRYFPTQDALDVELAAEDVWRDVEALLVEVEGGDPVEAIERLIDAVVTEVYRNERHVRTALRVYHDTWLRHPTAPVRKARRMGWIDRVIAPFPDKMRSALRLPLALAIGPDQVTMLKDIAGLNEAHTGQVLKWAARSLIEAARKD